MKTKNIFMVLIVLVLAVAVYFLRFSKIAEKQAQPVQPESAIKATFNCAGGKIIKAEFSDKKVILVLSDNRTVELSQAISASGARYANTNESFVFWNKGDTAFIEENGQPTFIDCLEASE